jgi:hypothetical protein
MPILRGYDIDGVLVPRKVTPIHPYIVISGRLFHDWPKTIRELSDIDSAIYLRPFRRDDVAECGAWKAAIINLAGVTEFFEDDPTQAAVICERCPQCLVHLVT